VTLFPAVRFSTERDLLEEARWNEKAAILTLEAQLREYELDLEISVDIVRQE
jgi:hypothetical protein